MCLLTFMQEGVTASAEDLTTGAYNNSDGFGFAIHAGNTIIRDSGLVFEPVLDKFLKLRQTHSGPALFHSRITTHGRSSLGNCHPFQVGRDTGTVVAHNGMLPIDSDGDRSDTRIFAEDLFPSWGGVRTLTSKRFRKRLAKFATGSKLVFLTTDREVRDGFVIINEKDGHWVDGVWWSNSSYKNRWTPMYSYSGSGLYTSGWRKTDAPDSVMMESSFARMVGNASVEDMTYYDSTLEMYVWGELWTCGLCDHVEYYDEDNIEMLEYCPNCRTCWWCSQDRFNCICNPTEEEPERLYRNHMWTDTGALSTGNYDSLCDINEEGY